MKKLLLGTLSLAALVGAVPALAADMPARPVAAAVSNWNGFYVGINAGGGFQSQEATLTSTGVAGVNVLGLMFGPAAAGGIGAPMWVSGPLGGFTVGWNWGAGWWLAGIEADIDCANITGITNLTSAGITVGVANTLDRLGTVRGRLGVLAGNNFLLYGTGGFAYGRNTLELSVSTTTLYNQDHATKTGWTAGGGVEWNFISNWTVKAEYLYVDLGSQTTSVTLVGAGPAFGTLTAQNNDRYHILRFGVNYIFGSLGKGVVAAY
jgi:outer membrane immunogenic protein